jgi:hypothetical protein
LQTYGHDPIVMRAIRKLIERHSEGEWWAMSAGQRTQAIYDEIKRLDAETAARAMAAS